MTFLTSVSGRSLTRVVPIPSYLSGAVLVRFLLTWRPYVGEISTTSSDHSSPMPTTLPDSVSPAFMIPGISSTSRSTTEAIDVSTS